ncbi:hypothetical protein FNW25_08930 [Flavobacterium franklandianum]|uniref:hypothetical protein n=1 Tax=Flavobacterium franklandianum TaxID=2594430 RepID=UPI00117AD2E3|nr:hypothetical protein [Flavobacterium franklandianum]TRX25547.1 hypothetical protein FNW25_08930 [Flavobacterium franklandianum]
MKKLLLITLILTSITTYSQEEKIQMISKFDYPEDNREYIMGNFLGIDKLDFSFTNSEKLIGKNFKITLRKYKNGEIEIEKIVINTKGEGLPTIKKDFKFSLITQQILNNEKIAFFFPGFFNKQIFDVNKKFKDGTMLLREVTGGDEKINFEIGKETQIALITPPNDNPDKGNLGYCEVSKGNIDVEKWYEKYKISEFFLIYLIVEE